MDPIILWRVIPIPLFYRAKPCGHIHPYKVTYQRHFEIKVKKNIFSSTKKKKNHRGNAVSLQCWLSLSIYARLYLFTLPGFWLTINIRENLYAVKPSIWLALSAAHHQPCPCTHVLKIQVIKTLCAHDLCKSISGAFCLPTWRTGISDS